MNLFDPVRLGNLDLANRIFMAPMTRGRASRQGVPTELMAQYYKQRASAGLIITEATSICPMSDGSLCAPGIHTDAHQAAWADVCNVVHNAGGKIFMQIWHMGATVLPDFIGGEQPLSASNVAAEGMARVAGGEKKPLVEPRAMTVAEIQQVVVDFKNAAVRAIAAGCDGVEIHAANGFLIDQFTRDSTNKRSDEYGGSLENRTRFLFEVVDAVVAEIGADKVGIRLAPTNILWGSFDSQPELTYPHIARRLSAYKLAYLHVFESISGEGHFAARNGQPVLKQVTDAYDGFIIINGEQTHDTGNQALADGSADAIAFGKPFLANPDLVERFRVGAPLNAVVVDTIYAAAAEGYTDYPALHD